MERPEQVPADARWNEGDGEWETGTVEDGVRRGDFTWWRCDGTLVGRSSFDEAGRLHGVCRRYRPDGQISLESRYVHDVRWGKTWHTRSLSGDSPEDVHLAAVPPSGPSSPRIRRRAGNNRPWRTREWCDSRLRIASSTWLVFHSGRARRTHDTCAIGGTSNPLNHRQMVCGYPVAIGDGHRPTAALVRVGK